jgi:NitT/TauT family transport system ATP-binding protein
MAVHPGPNGACNRSVSTSATRQCRRTGDRQGLRATNDGTLREGFFLDLLRRGFSAEEARRQLDIAIDWGRYGELFEYDSESGQLVLGSDPVRAGV